MTKYLKKLFSKKNSNISLDFNGSLVLQVYGDTCFKMSGAKGVHIIIENGNFVTVKDKYDALLLVSEHYGFSQDFNNELCELIGRHNPSKIESGIYKLE